MKKRVLRQNAKVTVCGEFLGVVSTDPSIYVVRIRGKDLHLRADDVHSVLTQPFELEDRVRWTIDEGGGYWTGRFVAFVVGFREAVVRDNAGKISVVPTNTVYHETVENPGEAE